MFYWSALYIGRGQFDAAARMINDFCAGVSDPEAVAYGQWLRAWTLRAQERYAECIASIDAQTLSDDPSARYCKALIGVERAIAAVLSGRRNWLDSLLVKQALDFHIHLRARHYLLRWRILFALDCHRRGDERWDRHVRFILHELARDDYATLLIHREPELAEWFWAMCAREDIALTQAVSALRALGKGTRLNTHLEQSDTDRASQLRLLETIAIVGDERAIPGLERFRPSDPEVRQAQRWALDRLEALPPPVLEVTLMGELAVRRDGTLIDPDAWYRPSAYQLFEYFCVHRGQWLSRERVLREVWPGSAEADLAGRQKRTSAKGAFQIALSRLGSVIEPYLRRRSPVRYFAYDGESICFDPQRTLVRLDTDAFLAAIETAKEVNQAHSPMIDTTLATVQEALGTWRTPLTNARYIDWAQEMIERLNTAYVDGCVLLAEGLLRRDQGPDAGQAEHWANAATRSAPWHEPAWLALIRALARQGRRGEALHVSERATEALKRELGAPPSGELHLLAQHLRDNRAV